MIHKMNNPLELCQLKFANNDKGEFEGYGSVFNSNDKINDTIQKGAFSESIGKYMPKMFINHKHMDIPVGDWLTASEDSSGLFVAGKIDLSHRDGPSLYSAMKRKAMEGLSIGVPVSSVVFERKSGGGRLVTKADLKEVSVVTFPMEESAQIMAVKSEIQEIETLKEAESFLRDLGFSKSAATAFVSRISKLKQGDPAVSDEITKHDMTNHLVDFINNVRV